MKASASYTNEWNIDKERRSRFTPDYLYYLPEEGLAIINPD